MSGAAQAAPARAEQAAKRLTRLSTLTMKLTCVLAIVFWAMGVYSYYFFRRAMFIGSAFSGWLLSPVLALALIIFLWVRVRGIHSPDPLLRKPKRMAGMSIGLWTLLFPAPLAVLFLARPDLASPIMKLVFGNGGMGVRSVAEVVIVLVIAVWLWRDRLAQVVSKFRSAGRDAY